MKRDDNNRHCYRQRMYTAGGILCVLALFGIAMVFPKYYSELYDKKTLNHVSFTDVNVSTYKTSYDSFASKLYALSRAYVEGGEPLRAIRTNELGFGMNKDELTAIVNEELQKLDENKVLDSKIRPKEKRMTLCERYTIYGTQEADGMKGISCWKLMYENSKRTLTIYLDEEYHKIYSMKILYHEIYDAASKRAAICAESTDICQNVGNKMSTRSNTSGVVDASAYDGMQEQYRIPWEGMLLYYDFYSFKDVPYVSMIKDWHTGMIEFNNQYQIFLYKTYMQDQKGRAMCMIGLPLEKMIQF